MAYGEKSRVPEPNISWYTPMTTGEIIRQYTPMVTGQVVNWYSPLYPQQTLTERPMSSSQSPQRKRIRAFDEGISPDVANMITMIEDHVDQMTTIWPEMRSFADTHIGPARIGELALHAVDKIHATELDQKEHSISIIRGPVWYHISTLPASLNSARQWFYHTHGGYSEVLKYFWNNPIPELQFQSVQVEVFCHVIVGSFQSNRWVHMAIINIKGTHLAPVVVLPEEFLTEEERRMAGLPRQNP